MNAPTIQDYPYRATHDPDAALRALIARQLARQTYIISGITWPAAVVEGPVALPKGTISIHEEWADADAPMQLPAIVILDGSGTIARPPLTAAIDESTMWPAEGEAVDHFALRGEGEYEVQYSILCQATDRPTRRALLLAAWSALSGAMDYSSATDDRIGLVVDAGELYYGRKARIVPVGFGRQDTEDDAKRRHRIGMMTVRASIPIVSPVSIPAITETNMGDDALDSCDLAAGLLPLGVGD